MIVLQIAIQNVFAITSGAFKDHYSLVVFFISYRDVEVVSVVSYNNSLNFGTT